MDKILMFINIHTHASNQPNEWCLYNLHEQYDEMLPEKKYSIGIHPWYIENPASQFVELAKYVTASNVLAIGECGLDRVCSTDFDLQEKIFIQQLRLANDIGKPLIIHCVKAYTELLLILRKQENKIPVIFHGFNKNIRLANELIQAGYYLSFGKAVFNHAMQEVIRTMPVNKIFFENDSASISMYEVYEKAASLLSMPINDLSLQIQENTNKVIGISF